jgi:hemolysin D
MSLVATPPKRDKEYLAFLPAALEIVETPASPLGRLTAYTIIVLFCLAIAWSYFGKIDIVAAAKGKIIPSGRTKIIQPFETGVVRAIHVRDGQTVKTGDVLIELDPTMTDAESRHYQSDLTAAQLDVARLRAELAEGADPLQEFRPPADAPAAMVTVQRQFLLDQIGQHQAKLAVFDRQSRQKQAERDTIEASLSKLEASLPILQQRADIKKALLDHGTGSKANYLEILQLVVEGEHELDVQKRHRDEAIAAIATIGGQKTEAEQDFRRERSSDLAEAERKASGLREDLVKAQRRVTLQALTSPVDGTVQQLAMHTVGGVVTPAQTLMAIVPMDSHLEIEAMVQNRDIGFVRAGQDAAVKVDAFNFNRYGLLAGHVVSVSPDAITLNKTPEREKNDRDTGAENDSSEPVTQELLYAARVSLDRTKMAIDDRSVDLAPGMAVTVEVKTGSRRIITYLLSPLLKLKQEALRER